MLRLHRPLNSDLTFRLVHDISPDNAYEEDGGSDYSAKQQYILSCLSQTKQKTVDRCRPKNHIERTEDKLGYQHKEDILVSQQKALEKLNNVINSQYLECQENKSDARTSSVTSEDLDKSQDKTIHKYLPNNRRCQSSNGFKIPKRPRKLPEIPRQCNAELPVEEDKPTVKNEKCLADELQEALLKTDSEEDDVFLPSEPTVTKQSSANDKIYPKFSRKYLEELKCSHFTNSVSKNTKPYLNSNNIYLEEDSTVETKHLSVASASGRDRRDSDDLEVTHRGMHRFIPRHKDEVEIEIGDPLHVTKTSDDLWCEGVNLRSGQQGIFPSMYATDLQFLEEETEDEDGSWRFQLRFLGSVEVNGHKGDEVLCQAINKVALSRRSQKSSVPPPLCTVEISQYGIRMLDKSKTGHEDTDFTHFFALKNISFCGCHPRKDKYFAFITKHPKLYRFACHVFLGEKSTRQVNDALGQAFKRFYQEYMALTHPTEDIYME
ncbi:C-Jun-amino-terminal kinase-interacting protein 1-like isoform X2 [Mytilus californianus]|uniref:C-Jun-amino-terminal kinase-interacting protein 1-like isoform X2 n=1 Tax=Mytilus californianus TaxID=6549 RepID=UPI00224830C6|nr:C-Jun-amino-terminal kinase-interacting protein 1-like isoform X2 [Mytilus californianus]